MCTLFAVIAIGGGSPQLTATGFASRHPGVQGSRRRRRHNLSTSRGQPLGREVSESAVLRAITELWQQLRIIPVVSVWQARSVAASAAALPKGHCRGRFHFAGHRNLCARLHLPAGRNRRQHGRSGIVPRPIDRAQQGRQRRGLVATRQVHTISFGHAPQVDVAGTLPEFAPPPTVYASSSMPASNYFLRSYERDDAPAEQVTRTSIATSAPVQPIPRSPDAQASDLRSASF